MVAAFFQGARSIEFPSSENFLLNATSSPTLAVITQYLRPESRNATKEQTVKMSFYDEIEIEDMTFDPALQIYHYPCPCGDRFEIFIGDMRDGEEVAVCPSCSLMIRVIFEVDDLPKEEKQEAKNTKVTVPV